MRQSLEMLNSLWTYTWSDILPYIYLSSLTNYCTKWGNISSWFSSNSEAKITDVCNMVWICSHTIVCYPSLKGIYIYMYYICVRVDVCLHIIFLVKNNSTKITTYICIIWEPYYNNMSTVGVFSALHMTSFNIPVIIYLRFFWNPEANASGFQESRRYINVHRDTGL